MERFEHLFSHCLRTFCVPTINYVPLEEIHHSSLSNFEVTLSWVNLQQLPDSHQTAPSLPHLWEKKKKKPGEKACGLRQAQENHLSVTVISKTDLTWGRIIYCQLEIEVDSEE